MKFAITAGHGGGAPGNTWGGVREADLMLDLRHKVATKLRELGHEVIEDGVQGENLSLTEAIKLVKRVDLALELHTNALNELAAGVEVIGHTRHKAVSQRIALEISKTLGIPIRRDKGFWNYAEVGRGLGFADAGGLIVEVFFQSNPAELKKYQERSWIVASAIVKALTTPV